MLNTYKFAAVTVFAVKSSVDIFEGESSSFCVELNDIVPFGGLEVDITVIIEAEGIGNLTGSYNFTLLICRIHICME